MTTEPIIEYPDLGVKLVKNVRITMDDGVRVAGDLYMPIEAATDGSAGCYSVVLEYIPYRKDDIPQPPAWNSVHAFLARNGYVSARFDCRGTGASDGFSLDEYTEREQHDGVEVVEWLARQPWCDGKVNMMGSSYGGFTSVQVAALAPPHLTSIIPIDFTDYRYTDDVHYVGGLLRMWCDPGYYSGFMIPFNALPPDPRYAGDDWAVAWEERLAKSEPWLLEWLRHQVDGPYWHNGSVGPIAHQIKCPVFMIASWWDAYPSCALRLTQQLQTPWKLLVGPWDHARPNLGIPGPRIDYLHEVLRWLNYWCKGEDNGIIHEPPVIVYQQRYDPPLAELMDKSGAWRAEASWPPAGQSEHTLFFADNGLLNDALDPEGSDELRYDPRVGISRGLVPGGQPMPLPVDQFADEARSRTYTTRPLEQDLHILGWPRVTLYASSSATVAAFVVTLAEVAPDGTSVMVSKGLLNATRRNSISEPEAVVPGDVMELDIQLQATGWTFTEGNCLRISVSNSDFPEVWPTPELAINQLHRGGDHASRVVLPSVPAQGGAPCPELRPSPDDATSRLAGHRIWEVTDDLFTGARTVKIEFDAVISAFLSMKCRVDPARPDEASIRADCVYRRVFGSLELEGRSAVVIMATRTHFHVTIQLEVLVSGLTHASKRWVESVPRILL